MPLSRPVTSPALYEYVMRLCREAKLDEVSNHRLHEERSRLTREWSGFFAEYPVAIGPNVIGAAWLLDADLEPQTGSDMLRRATQLILPASALGLPSLALPMGIADGLPVGIQILSDLWREDLCLEVAELVERGAWTCRPIDPATYV